VVDYDHIEPSSGVGFDQEQVREGMLGPLPAKGADQRRFGEAFPEGQVQGNLGICLVLFPRQSDHVRPLLRKKRHYAWIAGVEISDQDPRDDIVTNEELGP
jgi:hypothetical protein